MSKLSEKMKAGRSAVIQREAMQQANPAVSFGGDTLQARAPGAGHGAILYGKNALLQNRVDRLEAGILVIKIDPKKIRASKWANRHEDSFTSSEFASLKDEIASAGGNVQPIKVRPIPPGQDFDYEVVFGHRRHRACLYLGLPVSAVTETLGDKELFVEMDRENRQRADLRPYETGVMYAKALDEGLFSSARTLAEAASIDVTYLGRALALARLPSDVLLAFPSPLDLQFRWAAKLKQAIEKDPDVVLERARNIQKELPRPSSAEVLKQLTEGGSTVLPPSEQKITVTGKDGQRGQISLNPTTHRVVVNLKNIDPKRFKEFEKLIQTFLF